MSYYINLLTMYNSDSGDDEYKISDYSSFISSDLQSLITYIEGSSFCKHTMIKDDLAREYKYLFLFKSGYYIFSIRDGKMGSEVTMYYVK